MLTTAEKLDLKDLREEMVKICARKMPIAELELQKKSTDNKELANNTYVEVLRYTASHDVITVRKTGWKQGITFLMQYPYQGYSPFDWANVFQNAKNSPF